MNIETLNRNLVDFLRRNIYLPDQTQPLNWIFMDYPRYDATFPRISVTMTGAPTEPIGIGNEGLYFNVYYDIDIWIKKGNMATNTQGKKYTGSSYRDYLADEVIKRLILSSPIIGIDGSTVQATSRSYWKTLEVYDIKINSMVTVPYDDEYEIFRKTLGIALTIAREVGSE